MLEKEFEYYKTHQPELVRMYNDKFIVIKDEIVIGSYASHAEAYNEAAKKNEPGTFLIQHCTPGTESYTQTFYSRVIFDVAAF
jgi:hypothetical protein